MSIYKATINDKAELAITEDIDIVQTGDGQYHALLDGKPFATVVASVDMASKEVVLKVNGKRKTVKLQDEYDILVKKMGLSANVAHKVSAIKAPMPGLVLSILVEAGQTVAQGEPMLILEAMKMENVIKSPGEGTVKKVVVERGKPVDKGEVLIEMQ